MTYDDELTREYVEAVILAPATLLGRCALVGQDTVTCPGCGQLVDVGLELRDHRKEHGQREEVEEL